MLKLRSFVVLVCVVLAASGALAQYSSSTAAVGLGHSDELGDYLVGPDGMTLYLFARDPLGESVCSDTCAENWPPFTVDSADGLSAAEGIPGELGTIEREDGALQVTYNDIPLYYWARDDAPGDTTGQGVGGVWWVLPPATVYSSYDDELGTILVGSDGMTVYMFTNDEPGVSNCYDQCASNWPPVTAESADAIVPGVNLPGELSTVERTDGTLQVAYNGWPLYFYQQDDARGDTVGEGVGEVWFTVTPETVTLSSGDVGDFLAASTGMTLYTFENDEAGVSNCIDTCADNWPPLTVRELDRLVAGAGIEGELATIARDDGSLQVTYNGMPLYFYAEDQVPGDTTGHEVGDVWYVAAP
jgi:predicted lipoprotein with Yx(FWY)xxD motif